HICPIFLFFFFFFQAEDGIRDGHVTGVQTCALPISAEPFARRDRGGRRARPRLADHAVDDLDRSLGPQPVGPHGRGILARGAPRSEERRVGKECRFWWWPNG